MSDERLLKIEEVALLTGVSTQTLNNWYRWKRLFPDHELALLLPDYVQSGPRQIRYWHKSDIWALAEFKSRLPHGRAGVMGDITQKSRPHRKNKEV